MSRDEAGSGPRKAPTAWTTPEDGLRDGAADLDAPVEPAPGSGSGARATGSGRAGVARGRRVVATVLAAALVAGGFALGRRSAEAPTPVAAPSAGLDDFVRPGPSPTRAQEQRPTAYAQLVPDEDDRRASTVVVSWAGMRDLELDLRVVVAVVTDGRTRVDGARLGSSTGGSPGVSLDRGDLARAVLVAAGESAPGGVPVVHLRRTSGTVAVELVDEGDLTVATAPRVHLAVVRGTAVLQLVAVPLVGPRPRA